MAADTGFLNVGAWEVSRSAMRIFTQARWGALMKNFENTLAQALPTHAQNPIPAAALAAMFRPAPPFPERGWPLTYKHRDN